MRRGIVRSATAAGAAVLVGLLSVGCSSAISGSATSASGAASSASGSASPSNSDLLESTPFVGSGFAIQIPKGWKTDNTGGLGADVIFRNPRPDAGSVGQFTANINVLSPPASGDLDTVVRLVKAQIKQEIPDLQVVDDGPATTESGLAVYLFGGKFTQPETLPDELHDLRLIAIDGTSAYVVSATALSANYPQYEQVFRAALLSFAARP